MEVQPTLAPATASAPRTGANAMLLTIGPLLIATILGVAGQLILKHGMSQMGLLQLDAASVPAIMWRMVTSPYVIGGLLVYGMGTFFWLIVLNRVPLSFAYPFISLGIILGLLSAWGIFSRKHSAAPLAWHGSGVRRCPVGRKELRP